MKKVEEHVRKKYSMADDYTPDKVSDKIKMVEDIEKFDDTKILIDTDGKCFDENTLKMLRY